MTSQNQLRQALRLHVRPHLLDTAVRRLDGRFADGEIEKGVAAWIAGPENAHFLRDARVEKLIAGLRQPG